MTEPSLAGLRIGLVGPLPPPSGGMANQTRQLGELLIEAGATVITVQVNAPYRPAWAGRVPVLRAVFRLMPYLLALWRCAGQVQLFHIMANSGWAWHLFAAPAVWVAHWRGIPAVVNYRGGEAAAFLERSQTLVRFTLRHAHALVVARNLEPLYDNLTAIRAFQTVLQTWPQARLTVAGSGPQAAELQQFVQSQGLAHAVQFTGRLERDAMAALYRSADLVLNPSLADNMPNSVLEAWASGVPVVSTNVGGIPYLAQDGITATLVSPSNPAAMAQACLALLADAVPGSSGRRPVCSKRNATPGHACNPCWLAFTGRPGEHKRAWMPGQARHDKPAVIADLWFVIADLIRNPWMPDQSLPRA